MRLVYKIIYGFIILLAGAIVLFIVVYFDATCIEPNWIEVRKVYIASEPLYKALGGKKVVQISDLDMKSPGYREKSLVRIINKLNPDILFFTGDLVDSWLYFDAAMDIFRSFKIKGRIYAIPGDNDYANIKDMDFLQEKFRQAGVIFLRSRAVKLSLKDGNYFWLVFLDRKKNFDLAV